MAKNRSPVRQASKLSHPWWVGVVLPLVLAVLATFSPDSVRIFLLLCAIIASTATFYQTEFAERKVWKTFIACCLFSFLAAIVFRVGRLLNSPNQQPPFEGGLSLSIDDIMVSVNPADSTEAQILLTASLANRGSPSIADGWSLSIKTPSKNGFFRATGVSINPNYPIKIFLRNGTIQERPSSDALYLKARASPIAKGDKVTGYLEFIVHGASQDEVYQKGTVLMLSCRDVMGRPVLQSHVITGTQTPSAFVPGTEYPTIISAAPRSIKPQKSDSGAPCPPGTGVCMVGNGVHDNEWNGGEIKGGVVIRNGPSANKFNGTSITGSSSPPAKPQ